MARHPDISEDEQRLFRDHAAGTRRLRSDRVAPPSRRVAPVPAQSRRDDAQVVHDMMSDLLSPEDLETGDELLFHRAGLQHQLLRKLRRGQFSVGSELDLHGKTVPEARAALAAFLAECRSRHVRCVRVVHGKGLRSRHKRPVLKTHVAHWLRQRDEVLAYCTTPPNDGGSGALYVLLKRI